MVELNDPITVFDGFALVQSGGGLLAVPALGARVRLGGRALLCATPMDPGARIETHDLSAELVTGTVSE